MAIIDVTRIAAAIAKQVARKVWDVELICSTRVYRGRWQRFLSSVDHERAERDDARAQPPHRTGACQ